MLLFYLFNSSDIDKFVFVEIRYLFLLELLQIMVYFENIYSI